MTHNHCSCWIGIVGLLSVVLALTGCQSGLGSVSPQLVELYDMGTPGGVIEIEVDREGKVHAMEGDIPVEALPAKVRETAMAKAPGGRIIGAEREFMAGADGWEVKVMHEGREWEFVMDSDGKMLETEKGLNRAEAPAAVLSAADREMDGTFKSVELITTASGESEYHVKKTRDGASYKIVLTPEGKVKRKVREARAEIEIPLQ